MLMVTGLIEESAVELLIELKYEERRVKKYGSGGLR